MSLMSRWSLTLRALVLWCRWFVVVEAVIFFLSNGAIVFLLEEEKKKDAVGEG